MLCSTYSIFPFQLLIFGLGMSFCWFGVFLMMIAVDAVLTGGGRTVACLSGRYGGLDGGGVSRLVPRPLNGGVG
jgi:hypothetical protein